MKIPSSLHHGFRVLAELDAATFEKLLGELQQLEAGVEIFQKIEPTIRPLCTDFGRPESDARELTKAIQFLFFNLLSSEESSREFSKKLLDALKEGFRKPSESEKWTPDETQHEKINSRLKQLGDVNRLKLGFKAVVLANFDERLFLDCRVVTDIRPVYVDSFPDEDAQAPVNADEPRPFGHSPAYILVHKLRLDYRCAENNSSTHISLDAEDIDSLIRALKRAKNKAIDLRMKFENIYSAIN